MSGTEEILAKVDPAKAEIGESRTLAAQALEHAGQLIDQAVGHGWAGVAASMQGVRDALEAVIASLGSADDAVDEALQTVHSIDDQMSRPEVAEHLDRALSGFDEVRGRLDAATASTDEARRTAEHAGSPETLMGMLQGLGDGLDTAWRGLAGAKEAAEAERREATAWGS